MSVNATSRWNPQAYSANAGFVPALGAPVLELLAPEPGEHILDVGCGDGVLTERIVAAGAHVLGVDASPEMIAAAQARGLDARVVDCQALDFGPDFDALFSNAALHWMLDRDGVARGAFAALRPGGRFVGEMGGQGNVATLRRALRQALADMGFAAPDDDPQWYPSPEEFADLYGAAGFEAIDARLIDRPTPLPGPASDWFLTFRAGFLDNVGVPEEARAELAARAGAIAETTLIAADGTVVADYVRLRFTMRKPA